MIFHRTMKKTEKQWGLELAPPLEFDTLQNFNI